MERGRGILRPDHPARWEGEERTEINKSPIAVPLHSHFDGGVAGGGGGKRGAGRAHVGLFHGTRKLLGGILIASGNDRRHFPVISFRNTGRGTGSRQVAGYPRPKVLFWLFPDITITHEKNTSVITQKVLWAGVFQGTPGLKIRNRNLSEYFFRGLG